MEAVVEFDYEAEQDDELTLKVGDVIKNVITAEGGWWEGELGGKKGMFPDNFVKLKAKAPGKEEKREATQRKSVRELASKFKDGVPLPGAQGSVNKRKEGAKMKKCKVMFDYKAENEDELNLTQGQIVDFLKEVEEGWWEGSLDGKVGVFPSNFVEMIEEVGEGGPAVETNKPAPGEGDEDFQEIKGKKVMGVGLGNIFQGGPIQLRTTSKKPKPDDKDGKEPKPPTVTPPDVSKREKQSSKKIVERAMVRYSYVAEQPDELSLKEGEIVRIMDKNLEDEGWWRGEVNGKVGVFPDNFVELLPTQEEPSKVPKKPPPPVAKNIYPKLPEKTMSVEEKPPLTKKDPEPQAGSSVKKPMFPPPVGKKPGLTPPSKPEPPKPAELPTVKVEMRQKDQASNQQPTPPADTNNHLEDGVEANLDAVESSSHKLVHLTANRNKGPAKRPPSTVVFPADVDKGGSDTDDALRANNHIQPPKPPPPVTKDIKHLPPSEMERSHRQDSSEVPASQPSQPPPRPPEPVRHQDSAPGESKSVDTPSPALTRLVEELQREVRELHSNTISRTEYEDLRGDLQRLKQEFESFRTTQSKKLVDLMMEVDEEKKLRLTTQVEMERIKKMVAESHV